MLARNKKKKKTRTADDVLQQVLNRLPHEKERCVDVETTGLDWRKHCIVGYVLNFGPRDDDSYYVSFRHAGEANVGGRAGCQIPIDWDGKLAPGEKELVKAIDRPGTLAFGHNMAFDLRFLSRVGFTLQPRIEDTSINEPLLDEFVGKYSLEACANRHKVQAKKSTEIIAYLRQQFPEIKTDKEAMGHFWRLSGDDRMAVDYACGDGVTTWQLRDAQMKQIIKQELVQVHGIESRLIPVLARMMIRGIKVDEERLEWLISKINTDVEQLKNDFPSEFNARSPIDVQAWMEKHGHTDWPRTAPSKTRPEGSPSFTSDYLERHPAGQKIIKLRKWENLNASFCIPMQDHHLWRGRVHTSFNQLRGDDYGTVTGRLSSSDPNMQQVPKHDEELGRLYRSIFVPDYDLWGECDFSQIEPRLMAYYTRSKVFLNDYRTNPKADAHTAVSKAMLRVTGRNWDDLTPAEQRHHRNNYGKRVNQTVITGGGKNAIVHKYKVPASEAEGMIREYHRALPELRPFQQKAAQRFRTRGYVLSLLGRRARLQHRDKDYTAMNRLLQVGNADIIKEKMVAIDDFLRAQKAPVEMLLNCHDSISFQFDKKARPVYDECKRIMEDFSSERAMIKLDLPIVVDDGEGKNWAEATYE
jgi:DNA polymerase I-like protein with 3'-5' exonuclease and polymerase domains